MDLLLGSELDGSFEPLQRARSNTWPLPRPENLDESSMSPAMTPHANDGMLAGDTDNKCSVIPELGVSSNTASISPTLSAAHLKKSSSRRNAWGNLSYADLITQAITSSPDNRLTLSQIYEWMVQNVPYFKDKGDSNSSAGWKNSIRHNLSLHNRFMRVQNEGTGKSSWWILNPDAKPGKSTRRRATSMETSKFEKRRGRVKKKVDALRNSLALEVNTNPSSSTSEKVDLFPDFPESPLLGGTYQLSPDFRTRASSNASSCSRLSPIPALETEWKINYDSYLPSDRLAVSLAQRMKLNGSSRDASENYLYSTYQEPLYTHASFNRVTNGIVNTNNVVATSSHSCLIHPMQSCNYGGFPNDPKQSLLLKTSNSNPGLQYIDNGMDQNLLDDLNINIETYPADFECNVDEVIRHELSIEGSLDFNFGTTNNNGIGTEGSNLQMTSVAATTAATAAAAAAAVSKRNCRQRSFNDHSWVH